MSFKEFKERLTAFILKNDKMAKESWIEFDENARNRAKCSGIVFVGRNKSDFVDIYYGKNHKYAIRLLPHGNHEVIYGGM